MRYKEKGINEVCNKEVHNLIFSLSNIPGGHYGK